MNPRPMPGMHLRKALLWGLGIKACEQIVDPVLADMQWEWQKAMTGGDKIAAGRVYRGAFWTLLLSVGLWGMNKFTIRISRLSWGLIGAALTASLAGVLVLQAASGMNGVYPRFAVGQLIFILLGAALLLTMALLSSSWLKKNAPILQSIGLLLLGWVAFGGTTYEGLRRWVQAGPIQLQPACFALPLLLIGLAGGLESDSRRAQTVSLTAWALSLGLLALEPEPLLVLILGAAGTVMAFRAGCKAPLTLSMLGASVMGGLGAAFWTLQQKLPPTGALLHTDGIFGTWLAKAGVPGTALVMALLLYLAGAPIARARKAKDGFEKLLLTAVAVALPMLIFGRLALSEGMVLLSYGGSSIVGTLLLVGMGARGQLDSGSAKPADSVAS